MIEADAKRALSPARESPPEMAELQKQAESSLELSRSWPIARRHDDVTLSTGFLKGAPVRAYRSEVSLSAPASRVVKFLADDTFVELPRWSAEFIEGDRLEVVYQHPDRALWLVRARYRTPALLSNREYVYWFARQRLPDDSVLIHYRSLPYDEPPPAGFVRAHLHSTVHRVEPLGTSRCRLEHVLATDLGGAFGHWMQNNLLKGAMLDAHARDSLAQRQLLTEDARQRPPTHSNGPHPAHEDG